MKNIAEFWARFRVKTVSFLSPFRSFNKTQINNFGPVIYIGGEFSSNKLKPVITSLLTEKRIKPPETSSK